MTQEDIIQATLKDSSYHLTLFSKEEIDALVEALKAGTIKGAALDVFENEPNLASGLAELPNVVLTPHTASATHEARGAMAVLAAQAVLDVLAGKPPVNLVNK